MRVSAEGNQPPVEGSELAIETIPLGAGETLTCGSDTADTILLVDSVAHLVLAGERLNVSADDGSALLRASVGPGCDRHAALGPREHTVVPDRVDVEGATGKRSFEVLYGPHNGSTRATLFVGHVPPGAAPWHFHLYDEIVWISRGEGRFHTGEGSEPLGPGSAFRIRPREVHIVENTSPADELVVVGLFTPAGSPSAAYLAPEAPS
jgi:quercetin dioxygenase-like cupin family protein